MKRQRPPKRIVLGLTGSFGSGKTTVAGMFKDSGAAIIDADKIARRIIKPNGPVYKKIIAIFGNSILKGNKDIDRDALARKVFGSRRLLKKLNSIMHPVIIKIIRRDIIRSRSHFIVLDAPLLLEAGLRDAVDKIAVVKADKEQQIARLRKKRHLKRADILKRIESQMPLRRKIALADFIIDNRGTIRETRNQVIQIRRMLWRN